MRVLPHPVYGEVRLGCRLPTTEPKFKFKDYLAVAKLPGTPVVIDYSAKAMDSLTNMYLNDSEGDCVVAGAQHVSGVMTGNATGAPVIYTPDQTNGNYTGMSGGLFDPNDPSTDQGCDPEVAFAYWKSKGLLPDGSHKIAGWLGIDCTNEVEIRSAMWLFENVCPTLGLPDAWVNPVPSASGFVWDVAGPSDPNNGHFVCAVGCNTTGLPICTWAMLGTMTYAAIAAYCGPAAGGQLFSVISQDGLVKAMGKAPNGLNWDQLRADFDSIGGNA